MADVLAFDLAIKRNGFRLTGRAELPLTGITVLSGPSGSGKTTLLRALAGLEGNDIGSVTCAGQDWSRLPARERRIGFVFQDLRLFRHMTVAQNLQFGARRRGASPSEVADVVEALDLGDLLERKPASLSGGEARRVALARALASRPRLLFLDEPMVGLDPARRAEVLPYITRAADEFGHAVLYVSHSQFEKSLLADRELPISGGRVGALRAGPPRLLLEVAEAGADTVTFYVGDSALTLPGTGRVGQTWELRPGFGSVLAQNHPGAHSAVAAIPVEFVAHDSEAGLARVNVSGQQLALPCTAAFKPGQKLWLICPSLRGRARSATSAPGGENR